MGGDFWFDLGEVVEFGRRGGGLVVAGQLSYLARVLNFQLVTARSSRSSRPIFLTKMGRSREPDSSVAVVEVSGARSAPPRLRIAVSSALGGEVVDQDADVFDAERWRTISA